MNISKSIESYKSYLSGINIFYSYITLISKKKFNTDIELLKYVTVDEYKAYFYEIKTKNKKSTVNSRISATKQLFSYAVDKGYIEKNPTKSTKAFSSTIVKNDTDKKETLTIDEIRKILDCSYIRNKYEKNFDFKSTRDRFLLSLLATTGIRINEALNIKLGDIEETQFGKIIKIKKNIDSISRRIPITDGVIIYFREYYSYRLLKHGKDKEGYLFLSMNNRKMEYSAAQKLLSRAIEKANIGKKITTYSFRQSLIQILIEKNINESIIYKIIGCETMTIYFLEESDPKLDKIKFKVCNIL